MAACEENKPNRYCNIWHAWSGYLGYQMLKIISSKKLLGLPALKHVQEDMVKHIYFLSKAHQIEKQTVLD